MPSRPQLRSRLDFLRTELDVIGGGRFRLPSSVLIARGAGFLVSEQGRHGMLQKTRPAISNVCYHALSRGLSAPVTRLRPTGPRDVTDHSSTLRTLRCACLLMRTELKKRLRRRLLRLTSPACLQDGCSGFAASRAVSGGEGDPLADIDCMQGQKSGGGGWGPRSKRARIMATRRTAKIGQESGLGLPGMRGYFVCRRANAREKWGRAGERASKTASRGTPRLSKSSLSWRA